jgi:hypothetical protein
MSEVITPKSLRNRAADHRHLAALARESAGYADSAQAREQDERRARYHEAAARELDARADAMEQKHGHA